MQLTMANGAQVDMQGWLRGASVFMVCSGPSLKLLDLTKLTRPGIVTLGVNNSWAEVKPMLWVCGDPAEKYLITRWRDPSILKFAPCTHFYTKHGRLRDVDGEGRHYYLDERVRDMPGVLGYPRHEYMTIANFFTAPNVMWGCGRGCDELGIGGGYSVMLAALRIAHYLGASRLYVVGADFNMTSKQPYAFAETTADVSHNNRLYWKLNRRLAALAPVAESAGMRCFNCTPGGNLTAFPRMAYDDAIEHATKACDRAITLQGWYAKGDKTKPPPSTKPQPRRTVSKREKREAILPTARRIVVRRVGGRIKETRR
jgi:hypothetical protein